MMLVEEVDFYRAVKLINSASSVHFDALEASQRTQNAISSVALPHGFTSLVGGSGVIVERAKKYLQGRGFNVAALDMMGVGVGTKRHEEEALNYFGYIILPVTYRGKLTYYLGRDFIGNYLRYKNPSFEATGLKKSDVLYNEDALDYQDVVFINEGIFDALTIGTAGVATQGWQLSEVQKRKLFESNARELVWVADIGYYKQAVKIALEFSDFKKVKVLDLFKFKHLGKDANEIGRENVLSIYEQTDYVKISDLI